MCLAGCRKPEAAESTPAPMTKQVSSGPVTLTTIADPPSVRLDRDVFLTMKTEAPSHIEVRLPPIADRLTGFTMQGFFDKEPVTAEDRIIRERCFRLAPLISEEYRIGPMAVTVVDTGRQPPTESWFPTPPLSLEPASLITDGSKSIIGDIVGPMTVLPGIRTLVLWLLGTLLVLAAAASLWLIARRIHRAIRLKRMSPKERALFELTELLKRDLVGKNRIKDFYVELTMIVRRYIERAHKIRAPKQTTEEFLADAAMCPRFREEVVHKLRDFLRSADLVKFAAFRPDAEAIDRALNTARDYIQTDDQAAKSESTDV